MTIIDDGVPIQDGRTPIQAFCTRITVKPTIQKGGMDKVSRV